MTNKLITPDSESPIERTPEQAHYYGLVDAFAATVDELGAVKLSKQEQSALKEQLASRYYTLIACEMHARQTSLLYVCEAVIDAWGISRKPPINRKEQKAAIDKYEIECLRETETNLIEAENALRMPRLAKRRRKLLEDDVTFYGSELVWFERVFKGIARRRICTRLIDEHKIDRAGPLEYHYK
jgi:hypothetical protein